MGRPEDLLMAYISAMRQPDKTVRVEEVGPGVGGTKYRFTWEELGPDWEAGPEVKAARRIRKKSRTYVFIHPSSAEEFRRLLQKKVNDE